MPFRNLIGTTLRTRRSTIYALSQDKRMPLGGISFMPFRHHMNLSPRGLE